MNGSIQERATAMNGTVFTDTANFTASTACLVTACISPNEPFATTYNGGNSPTNLRELPQYFMHSKPTFLLSGLLHRLSGVVVLGYERLTRQVLDLKLLPFCEVSSTVKVTFYYKSLALKKQCVCVWEEQYISYMQIDEANAVTVTPPRETSSVAGYTTSITEKGRC
ncbi:hypothetical protein BaRGS_00009119 [Batillaria attramentaria]|uniref:Uncharacterized protein n=1 Tax=Batillaria attramentaria TaxID=370345 RepID=A0ABD0LKG1_9CAEN